MTVEILLYIGLAAAAVLPAVLLYLRGEPPVPTRPALLGLRIATLLLVALLLIDPVLPGSRPADASDPALWVVVDGTRALDVPTPEGGLLRDTVVARATAEARGGARLALVGPEPEGIDTLSLPTALPRPSVTDLRPSLLRLAEVGADSILLLSPLRFPPGVVERATEDLPVAVALARVGDPVRNAGVWELELPTRAPAGEAVEGALVVFGEGGEVGDSVRVEVEVDGEAAFSVLTPLPPPGTRDRIPVTLPAMPDSGTVRVVGRVELDGDLFPFDDARVRHLRVGPPEGGILLLSFEPDWEPRVLLPTLEAVTGLPGEGYLRLGTDDWLPLVEGAAAAPRVPASEFRDRMDRAGLLVLHGVGAETPNWLEEAVAGHPRVIHLPTGSAGARLASLSPAAARSGEWTPDAQLPPSPVAPYLAGLPLATLPPLTDLRPGGVEGGTTVFRLRPPTPGGEPLPGMVLREGPEGRRAVALARGFWRWGHRSGPPREAYRGLWSGVAGWVLAEDRIVDDGTIRPRWTVILSDAPSEWHATGDAGTAITLQFSPEAEAEVEMDVEAEADPAVTHTRELVLDEDGRGFLDPLPPGRWEWTVDPDAHLAGRGLVEVEEWSDALATPPLDPVPPGSERSVAGADQGWGAPGGRPLRTSAWPYLLLLAFLSLEWVGRRRAGLR